METDDKKPQQGSDTPQKEQSNTENADAPQQNQPDLSDAPTFEESWDKQQKFRAD